MAANPKIEVAFNPNIQYEYFTMVNPSPLESAALDKLGGDRWVLAGYAAYTDMIQTTTTSYSYKTTHSYVFIRVKGDGKGEAQDSK